MILISHRGNISGKQLECENEPSYIDFAIKNGFNVEIDVRYLSGRWFLGHDTSQYIVEEVWILDKFEKLWIHCKNKEAIERCEKISMKFNWNKLNYFWHQDDTLTLTSLGYIWALPGEQPIENSIAVLPDFYNDDISKCIGICSDNIIKYKENG